MFCSFWLSGRAGPNYSHHKPCERPNRARNGPRWSTVSRSSTPGATRTTVDPRRAGPDPLSGVTGRPDVFTVPVHSFREAPHNGRVQRDPCDDAGGHVRAPIEPLARAVERGPPSARFLDCCVARDTRAVRSQRHVHWLALASSYQRAPEMWQERDPRLLRARLRHVAGHLPSARVAWDP